MRRFNTWMLSLALGALALSQPAVALAAGNVDKPVGRLTLLRDFLDKLPDTHLPVADIPWPEIEGDPRKERYRVLQPIPSYRTGLSD